MTESIVNRIKWVKDLIDKNTRNRGFREDTLLSVFSRDPNGPSVIEGLSSMLPHHPYPLLSWTIVNGCRPYPKQSTSIYTSFLFRSFTL